MLDRGDAAARLTLVGDSSGGGLVMSTLLKLRELGLPLPGGAVLFCPWVDLNMQLAEQATKDSAEVMQRCAAAYLGGHPADDPIASPLGADLGGLPKLLIQAATGDEHLPDARALAEHARASGLDAELELYPVDAHVFQIFWSFLPEAAEAIEAAGRFAREGGVEKDEQVSRG
jgi:acetyl esterase/lipase